MKWGVLSYTNAVTLQGDINHAYILSFYLRKALIKYSVTLLFDVSSSLETRYGAIVFD